jgi:hypothetical protein
MKKKGKKVLKGNTTKSVSKKATNPNHKEDFERVLKAFVTPARQTK